jgi:hypothetical protein
MTEPTTAPQPAAVSRNPWRSGSRLRVVLGFIAAVGVPFVWIVANWGSAWYAFFFVFFAILPVMVAFLAYQFLKYRRQLRVWWIVLVGAVVTMLPTLVAAANVMPPLINLGGAAAPPFELTPSQVWGLFVMGPLQYGLYGAVGGLVGWLVAYGPRLAAPPDS